MERDFITKLDTTTTIDDDDRISELPDFVAHHILSFLVTSPAELIRMSVLSKRWFALTASSPTLVFNIESFTRPKYRLPGFPYEPEYAKDIFFKYVAYTTSRFSQQQNVVSANTFDLFARLENPAHADILDRCLRLVLKQGLRVFVIFNTGINICDGEQPPPMYRLHDKLLSVSSLTYLRIHYCKLPYSLMVDDDAVKFKTLKVLYLDGVYLNEKMIKRLTAGCPRLEKFDFHGCYGFKKLCVNGLQNLQNVVVFYRSEVEEIDIQAPNLAYVHLLDTGTRDEPPCVKLFSCQKLSMISEGCISKQFLVSLSNFPFLETLILKISSKYNYINLKLSSHSLRKLSLETQNDLDKIKINTPNLIYFQYYARWSTGHRPIRDSGESKTCMDCSPNFDVDISWFQKFRRFLDRTIPFKVLKMDICANLIDVEELKRLESSPFELDHIELHVSVGRELSLYLPVVEAVLWCCRPRSLTLIAYSYFDYLERWNLIVKFTHEKLLEQEDHRQTNVQIVFSTVKAFRSNHMLITFLKEEVSQQGG